MDILHVLTALGQAAGKTGGEILNDFRNIGQQRILPKLSPLGFTPMEKAQFLPEPTINNPGIRPMPQNFNPQPNGTTVAPRNVQPVNQRIPIGGLQQATNPTTQINQPLPINNSNFNSTQLQVAR